MTVVWITTWGSRLFLQPSCQLETRLLDDCPVRAMQIAQDVYSIHLFGLFEPIAKEFSVVRTLALALDGCCTEDGSRSLAVLYRVYPTLRKLPCATALLGDTLRQLQQQQQRDCCSGFLAPAWVLPSWSCE